jgi:hypothetical protein
MTYNFFIDLYLSGVFLKSLQLHILLIIMNNKN